MRKRIDKIYPAVIFFALVFAVFSAGCTGNTGFGTPLPEKFEDTTLSKTDISVFDDAQLNYVSANGVKIGYKQAGKGDSLVMVMGYAATMDAWSPYLLNSLAENYSVVIFDNRGTGYTEPGGISPENMTYEIYADDTAALMDALGIKKAYLMGWSMGTAVSQEIILKYPEKVEKAVLYAPYSGVSSSDEKHLREYLRQVAYGEVNKTTVIENMFPKTWLSCHNPDEYLPVSSETLSENGILAAYNAGLNWNGSYERLNHIDIPVILIVGTEDVLTPPEFSKAMAGEIDGAWTAEFKGAGHGLMYQNPQGLSKTVKLFLDIDEDISCC